MAKINICDVEVLDNPATFFDKFKFKITFECHEPLTEDLEWKVVYVGSAYNSSLDQTLDSILVGPIPVGRHQFVFEVDPPDPKKINQEDIVGVTVVLIQALYRDREFIRVGYYVNNEYTKEELRNEPPAEPLLNELERTVITTDPRVTRFPIDWGDGLLDGCPEPEQKEEDVCEKVIDPNGEVEGMEEGDDDEDEDDDEQDVEGRDQDEGMEEPEDTEEGDVSLGSEGEEDDEEEEDDDEEGEDEEDDDDEGEDEEEGDEGEEETNISDEAVVDENANAHGTTTLKKDTTSSHDTVRPSSPLRQI